MDHIVSAQFNNITTHICTHAHRPLLTKKKELHSSSIFLSDAYKKFLSRIMAKIYSTFDFDWLCVLWYWVKWFRSRSLRSDRRKLCRRRSISDRRIEIPDYLKSTFLTTDEQVKKTGIKKNWRKDPTLKDIFA